MHRWRAVCIVIFAIALSGAFRPALAWGPEAHRTIALIADRLLQSDAPARTKITGLLATDKDNHWTKTDIGSEATWADVLRDKSEEARSATSAWHAVRLKPESPDLAAACFGRKPLPEGYPASHGPRDNCIVDKILQFQNELGNADTSEAEKVAAVQFLLNLVGDLHDPLQAIDRGDQGGRCIALQIGGKPPVRLATYWEATLSSEVIGRDPARAAIHVAGTVPQTELDKWAAGNPESWAQETFEVAKTVTYSFTAEKPAGKYNFPAAKGEKDSCGEVDLYKVGPEYETKALDTIKAQLAKAGVRLAIVLRAGFK